MSIVDKQTRAGAAGSVQADLADLGTFSEEEFAAAQADAQRQAERDRALQALEKLERDGRLLLG